MLADVTNNHDPDNLGRVKLSFPWMSSSAESGWARVVTPLAGDNFGLYCLPEVGDEVLVMFERGDMNHPFVIGSLWHEKAIPPADNQDGKNNLRMLKSRSGHLVQLDDTADQERIVIQDKSGKNQIVIDTQQNTISITAEKDLKITTKGKISMQADGDIALRCDNLTVDAKGKLELLADQDAQVGCASFKVDAQQQASMKASQSIGIDCMAGVRINQDGLVVT